MRQNKKRKVDIVVISDVHLGTYGCRAEELLNYMQSIKPKQVILNGDILDIWQFKKSYWPKSHMRIIKQIISWVSKGVTVHYITGNHDEMLRKFDGFQLGSLSIKNKLVLNLSGQKAWFFHGDVFDITMQHSVWLAKLGSVGYDFLIKLNSFVNYFNTLFNREKSSLSKKIKNKVKAAVKFINDFEKTATRIAFENKYQFVVCGHIHQPEIKEFKEGNKKVVYMNSGDWVENLTALEYHNNTWSIYTYDALDFMEVIHEEMEILDKSSKEIFNDMLADFQVTKPNKSKV